MVRTIRFQFDEHLSHAVAVALRRRGIDVLTTVDAGLRSAGDETQLDRAFNEGRVFVTCDQDDLIMASQGVRHVGIVFAPRGSKSIGQWIECLTLIHGACHADEMINRIEYV